MPTNNQDIEKLYYELVEKYISFETVSASPSSSGDIDRCVAWLYALLTKYGFDVNIVHGYLNPIIIAEYKIGDAPTSLVYGHYDVQPAEKNNGWQKSPFKIDYRNSKLIARGIADNKGQFLVHLATIINLIDTDSLKYNVKLLIEGNEETGSPKIEAFVKDYKESLKSDFVLISDGSLTQNRPTIEASLRGGTSFTVKLNTAKTELHSGSYGGGVPNAALELSKVLSKLTDQDHNILVPDFYSNTDKFYKESQDKLVQEDGKEAEVAGVKKTLVKPDESFYSAIGLNPTIQITGMQSGFLGDGYKNSIPNIASAKLNIRTVGAQNTYQIANLVKEYLMSIISDYVDIEFEDISEIECADPMSVNLTTNLVKETSKILKKVYPGEIVYEYVGGSIPLVKFLQEEVSSNILLIPLVNTGCNMHGVDENYEKEYITKGIAFSKLFFSRT